MADITEARRVLDDVEEGARLASDLDAQDHIAIDPNPTAMLALVEHLRGVLDRHTMCAVERVRPWCNQDGKPWPCPDVQAALDTIEKAWGGRDE